jgi:hypothetical protein
MRREGESEAWDHDATCLGAWSLGRMGTGTA